MAVESAVPEHQVEGTRQRLDRSVLEQANTMFDLFLLGEANFLFGCLGCQLVAADNDALVVKSNRGAYLVPRGSIQYVKLRDDPQHLESISMLWSRGIR
jgi:hypothetical protein